MKKFNELLLRACGYTVLIITIFFIFLTFNGSTGFKMDFASFISIFSMSCLISASSLIFLIEKLSSPVRIIIHSAALLCAILCMLGFTGYLASKSPADFFVIIFAYIILYALIFTVSHFAKKGLKKFSRDNEINKKISKPKNENSSDYKPRFR